MAEVKTKSQKKLERKAEEDRERQPTSVMGILREWADALVIAFLLAMFIRTFVVELFKIPSGSMTPTLIGTSDEKVMEWDVDGDGEKDLILDHLNRFGHARYHVFYRKGGKFVRPNEELDDLNLPLEAQLKGRMRNDRIIVNKFIYWLRQPRRGEIVVFRVPPSIYQRDKPIYIKRVIGLPEEEFEIRPPDVYANGKKIDTPEVFERIEYVSRNGFNNKPAKERTVPDDGYFVFGDNSKNSQDSRYWGAVKEDRLKGMALFRYWPLDTIGFLE